MLIAMAWRNLWRNRRRTLSAVAAVAGGVVSMVIVSSLMNGMSDRMVEAVTSSSMGHVQVHRDGYRSKRWPSLVIKDADRVLQVVRSTEGVEAAAGRVYGSALASIVRGEDHEIRAGGGLEIDAPAVILMGVEPTQEGAVTDLEERVVEGRWLRSSTDVVLCWGIARHSGAEIGDAFLPSSTGLDGATRGPWAVSDEVPRVVGIVRTGVDELDRGTVLMTREYLSALLAAGDDLHEIAIRARSLQGLDALVGSLRRAAGGARAGAGPPTSLHVTSPLLAVAEREGSAREVDAGSDGDVTQRGLPLRLVGVEPGQRRVNADAIEGSFLQHSVDAVLSSRSAADLGVEVGDAVVVDVPVDCGDEVEECPPASERFLVVGLLTSRGALFDGRFAFVSRQVVRDNIAALAPSLVTELGVDDARRATALVQSTGARFDDDPDEILPWYDLAPEIRAILVVFDAAPVAMVIVIFLAVAIGIVNTLLMATFERIKELGLMKSLGMRPSKLVALVLAESALLALVGIVVGASLGIMLVWSFSTTGLDLGVLTGGSGGFSIAGVAFDPVIFPRLGVSDLLEIGVPVAIITTLAGVWPAIKAARIQVVDALRYE